MKRLAFFILLAAPLIVFGQIRFGVEGTYSGTKSNVDVPGYLSDYHMNVSTGYGSDYSLGFIVDFESASTLRMGFRSWKVPFNHTYREDDYNLFREEGYLHTRGFYIRYEPRWEYFFITCGFDIGGNLVYKNDLTVLQTSAQRQRQSEDNKTTTEMPRNFETPFNLVFGIGPSIELNDKIRIKGILGFVFPMKPVYDPGVSYQQVYLSSGDPAPDAEPTINYMVNLKAGVGLEYYFE